ncbi:hypothetical protein WP50_25965 [Lactiplantibacillus plantarum]|nr:hypothetical protein WP50_25965 [Lactiplantibacillus plantarum]
MNAKKKITDSPLFDALPEIENQIHKLSFNQIMNLRTQLYNDGSIRQQLDVIDEEIEKSHFDLAAQKYHQLGINIPDLSQINSEQTHQRLSELLKNAIRNLNAKKKITDSPLFDALPEIENQIHKLSFNQIMNLRTQLYNDGSIRQQLDVIDEEIEKSHFDLAAQKYHQLGINIPDLSQINSEQTHQRLSELLKNAIRNLNAKKKITDSPLFDALPEIENQIHKLSFNQIMNLRTQLYNDCLINTYDAVIDEESVKSDFDLAVQK